MMKKPKEGESTMDREELENFAKYFRQQRMDWGLTQDQVGQLVGIKYGTEFSQTTVSRFEALEMKDSSMAKVHRMIKEWHDDVSKVVVPGLDPNNFLFLLTEASVNSKTENANNAKTRKKRTTFLPETLEKLEMLFIENRQPTNEETEQIAKKLDLQFNEVKVWFCNRRQREKRQLVQTVMSVFQPSDPSTSSSDSSVNSPPSLSPQDKIAATPRRKRVATQTALAFGSAANVKLARKDFMVSSVPIDDRQSLSTVTTHQQPATTPAAQPTLRKPTKFKVVNLSSALGASMNSPLPKVKFPVAMVTISSAASRSSSPRIVHSSSSTSPFSTPDPLPVMVHGPASLASDTVSLEPITSTPTPPSPNLSNSHVISSSGPLNLSTVITATTPKQSTAISNANAKFTLSTTQVNRMQLSQPSIGRADPVKLSVVTRRLPRMKSTLVSKPKPQSIRTIIDEDDGTSLLKSPNEFLKQLVSLAASQQGAVLEDADDF